MKTAVFLDLDGTLWEWGVVPDSAQEAIRRAQANGHKILTNTGRARSEVPDMAYLGLDGFCFAAGAEVLLDGKTIVDEPLDESLIRQVAAVFDSFDLNYNLEAGEGSWICVNNQAVYQERNEQLGTTPDPIMNAPLVQDMPPEQWKHIHKAFYHGGSPVFAEVAAAMPEGVTLTELMPGIAEATAAGVTKATAMEAVRTYLGVGEWRTMACGDSDNDLTMLRAADVSVAMGNGNDNAKAAATWVTTDIHDDGLLNAFAHFGLLD
jgi:hypothetical protein